jgi:uncharacterized protein YcbK (DUF882 family)
MRVAAVLLLLATSTHVHAEDWSGASGHRRALFALPGADARARIAQVTPKAGKFARAAKRPGVYDLRVRAEDGIPVTLFTLVPFAAKQGRTRLGHYEMGLWPQESGGSPNGYAPPVGFMKIGKKDGSRRVSTRFRVFEFLTHDQAETWPKYMALRPELLDKLELTGDALKAAGRSDSIRVMSGFRTPQYNAPGVGAGGRVEDSRHLYGDAADIFVSADGDSLMDDLDGDGQVSLEDARWLLFLIEGVEADHPELLGGLGLYPATDEHGPFVHVDVRGKRARW